MLTASPATLRTPGASLAARQPAVELLATSARSGVPWFEPIVHLGTGAVIGWDLVLGPYPGPGHIGLGEVASAMAELRMAEGRPGGSTPFLVVPISAFRALATPAPNVTGHATTWLVAAVSGVLVDQHFPGRRLCVQLSVDDLARPAPSDDADAVDTALIDELRVLRTMGVRVALSGFCPSRHSLGSILGLPLDVLRFDPRLTAGLGRDVRSTVLANSVALLARGLGIDLLADGIDDSEHDDVLRSCGCSLGAGRRFRGPMSVPVAEPHRHEPFDGQRGFPLTANESARLVVLHASGALETGHEAALDHLAAQAAALCGTPVGLVTLVDHERQWNKAVAGPGASTVPPSLPRSLSLCAHAICGTELFVVDDIVSDRRFDRRGVVEEHQGVRFYAGAPVLTSDGLALGTVCVVDAVPRVLDAEQRAGLQMLAAHAAAHLELSARLRLAEHRAAPSPR